MHMYMCMINETTLDLNAPMTTRILDKLCKAMRELGYDSTDIADVYGYSIKYSLSFNQAAKEIRNLEAIDA